MSPEDVWKGLDDSLPLESDILSTDERDGVSFQRISFLGRETGGGRVGIFALFCYDSLNPSSDVVVLMQDSRAPLDEELCTFFVRRGYTVLSPDYRGVGEGDRTSYPECVSYAAAKDRDDICACELGADKTCWFEWVAVGLYARRYALTRTDKGSVCVVGVRDGGEIAWKMAALRDFSCAATLSAAGWLSSPAGRYDEPLETPEEGRAFAAGMDSQSYAPLVHCPVFMGCTMNDPLFDCDRAFDTFSRINPAYLPESSICYSMHSNALLDDDAKRDLFIFLSKHQKGRYAFVPAPATVEIAVDEEENLKASVSYDMTGIRESVRLFFSEDELLPSRRHWMCCDELGEDEYLLNVFRDSKRVFALARVAYANGYCAWSKILTRKVSGTFKNTENRNAILFSGDMDTAGFFEIGTDSLGGIFSREGAEPRVERREGVRGIFSERGFRTARVSLPRFSPDEGASVKLDIYCDRDAVVTITFKDFEGRGFSREERAVGGVWQTFVENERAFRGDECEVDFRACSILEVSCDAPFVCNNIMWL